MKKTLVRLICVGIFISLTLSAPALAQKKQPPAEEPKEAWVISYAIMMLCVGGGLFSVVRPGRRDPRK